MHLTNFGGRVILGIAEEANDSASFYEINPNSLKATLLSRVNIRNLGGQGSRSDPEGIALFNQGGRLYAAISIERVNRVLILNLSNPKAPVKDCLLYTSPSPRD